MRKIYSLDVNNLLPRTILEKNWIDCKVTVTNLNYIEAFLTHTLNAISSDINISSHLIDLFILHYDLKIYLVICPMLNHFVYSKISGNPEVYIIII